MGQGPSSPFSYVLEAAPERNYSGVGQLFQGKKTAASAPGRTWPVSVLVLQDDKGKSEVYAREIKRLRSPDLIRFMDRRVVGDKVWLVTESIAPLEAVRESLTCGQLMMAVERTLHALHFLHTYAGLSHNNVSVACIFVHRNADLGNVATFKLGGLENCSSRPSSDGKLSTHPQPPESPAAGKKGGSGSSGDDGLPIHCRDIWQLGFVVTQLLDTSNGMEAVGRLALAMRSPEPDRRPTATQLLKDPFFANDVFLKTFSFLASFRAHSQAAKRAFFGQVDSVMGRVAGRDLAESLMPLLVQTDVLIDKDAEGFWARLFADGARAVRNKSVKLESGILMSEFSDNVVPCIAEVFNSELRSRKAAAMSQLRSLLPLLPGKVVVSLVLPNVVDCLKDSDRGLCCAALDVCEHLTAHWISRKDEEGLAAVNGQFMIELRSLALDKDAVVRKKTMDVTGKLILMYDRINGMAGIRVLVGALGDPDESVVVASLESIERLKGIMTSAVTVNVVLPGLVPLLLSKNESVRSSALHVISYLTHLVAQAKDVKSWPDVVPVATPLIGSTRRKNLFVGALVEAASPATMSKHSPIESGKLAKNELQKKQEEEEEEEDEDDDGDAQWTSWKDPAPEVPEVPAIPARSPPTKTKAEASAEFFAGLHMKKEKNAVMHRSSDHPGKIAPNESANRNTRSHSSEAVVPVEKPAVPAPEISAKDAPVFMVPSPRKRAELPAKAAVVIPNRSPPSERKKQAGELEELLKGRNSSEEEEEKIEYGAVVIERDSDDDEDESETDQSGGMLDLVLQSQKMRSDIIATRGGVLAPIQPIQQEKKTKLVEEKNNVATKSKLFDLPDAEVSEPALGGDGDGEGGWGDFELPE